MAATKSPTSLNTLNCTIFAQLNNCPLDTLQCNLTSNSLYLHKCTCSDSYHAECGKYRNVELNGDVSATTCPCSIPGNPWDEFGRYVVAGVIVFCVLVAILEFIRQKLEHSVTSSDGNKGIIINSDIQTHHAVAPLTAQTIESLSPIDGSASVEMASVVETLTAETIASNMLDQRIIDKTTYAIIIDNGLNSDVLQMLDDAGFVEVGISSSVTRAKIRAYLVSYYRNNNV
jgi:hypothetical protein